MATSSVITFVSKQNDKLTPIVSVYQYFDGYLSGVGVELAKWLIKKSLINGMKMDQYNSKYANGVGCLAAQFIRDFKTSVGGLYVCPTSYNHKWIDYHYMIIIDDPLDIRKPLPLNDITKIYVTVFDNTKPIFEGSPEELIDGNNTETD